MAALDLLEGTAIDGHEQVHRIRLPASAGERIAWLHSRGEVLDQTLDREELELSVRLSPDNWARFQAMESA